jgi:hypothetical protein
VYLTGVVLYAIAVVAGWSFLRSRQAPAEESAVGA